MTLALKNACIVMRKCLRVGEQPIPHACIFRRHTALPSLAQENHYFHSGGGSEIVIFLSQIRQRSMATENQMRVGWEVPLP